MAQTTSSRSVTSSMKRATWSGSVPTEELVGQRRASLTGRWPYRWRIGLSLEGTNPAAEPKPRPLTTRGDRISLIPLTRKLKRPVSAPGSLPFLRDTPRTMSEENLELAAGQTVLPHGPDRNLSVDEIGGISAGA